MLIGGTPTMTSAELVSPVFPKLFEQGEGVARGKRHSERSIIAVIQKPVLSGHIRRDRALGFTQFDNRLLITDRLRALESGDRLITGLTHRCSLDHRLVNEHRPVNPMISDHRPVRPVIA